MRQDALQQPLIFLWQLARVVQQYRQYNPSSIEGAGGREKPLEGHTAEASQSSTGF